MSAAGPGDSVVTEDVGLSRGDPGHLAAPRALHQPLVLLLGHRDGLVGQHQRDAVLDPVQPAQPRVVQHRVVGKVTEWKFYRITFLDVRGPGNAIPDVLTKAAILCDYKLSQILQLRFYDWDKVHKGTIKDWVVKNDARQLKDYINSAEVTKLVKDDGLELRAHLVIIVGSRHILLWDMDKDGNLAEEPRLVEMTSVWKR
jgi:hypothetical protein